MSAAATATTPSACSASRRSTAAVPGIDGRTTTTGSRPGTSATPSTCCSRRTARRSSTGATRRASARATARGSRGSSRRGARSALATRSQALAGATREQPFAFVEDGVVFRGCIDLCGWEPDGTLLVVDYKTNALEGRDARRDRGRRVPHPAGRLRARRRCAPDAPVVEVAFAFLEEPDAACVARFAAADEPVLAGELREPRSSGCGPPTSPRARPTARAPTAARSTGSAPGRGSSAGAR